MKWKAKVIQEFDVRFVRIEVAVRYDEEDIPNDFPLRDGDMWKATVEIDTGRILDWPTGKSGKLHMKVCDSGTYILWAFDGKHIAEIQGYCPNDLIPGEYGDYIDLEIDADGIITNWPKTKSLEAFFQADGD